MAERNAGSTAKIELDRMSVAELRTLIAEAEVVLREKQEKAKADLLAKWKAEAEENGLSFQALLPGIPTGPTKAPRKGSGEPLPVKYRGPNGEEWSGRGRLPRWLQAMEAEGRRRDEFIVK
ncbi:H-NS family nucleoid-associated regulatory protein [Falsiroseomonas sp. CW058]|uniref:H-NS histone family protein n=1 Tax=Falsiroseomonas sp. CW058 TaxID=3388664 RepID=UPI003D322815